MKPEETKFAEWLAAEQAFGCEFTSFERIAAGKSSFNYKAVTPDGHRYFVKITKPYRIDRILARVGVISSPLIPGLAFGGKVGSFGKDAICAIDWCERGENIPPHLLTTAQMKAICEGYREISRALSAVDHSGLSKMDGMEEAAKKCGITPRPIHGDFHYQNYYLHDGVLSACYDMECMRLGLPTEDLLRIFVHAIERTRFWRLHRLNVLYKNLTEMVRVSDYPKSAWLAAVEIYRRYKTGRRLEKSSYPIIVKIDNWFRAPYYRRFRRAVEEA